MKKEIILTRNDALIVTDVQLDFLPGGALPVPEGELIIPALNEYITLFKNADLQIFAIRDWHPPNHVSFKLQGGPWPVHCVENTNGAEFSRNLKLPSNVIVISKAINPRKESYSGFDETELATQLKRLGISRIFIGGFATDFCVKYTALDALELGFKVVLLSDAINGINLQPGDAEKAIGDMTIMGAEQVALDDFPEPIRILPIENEAEDIADGPLNRADIKKKTRMRPRGPYKKVRSER